MNFRKMDIIYIKNNNSYIIESPFDKKTKISELVDVYYVRGGKELYVIATLFCKKHNNTASYAVTEYEAAYDYFMELAVFMAY